MSQNRFKVFSVDKIDETSNGTVFSESLPGTYGKNNEIQMNVNNLAYARRSSRTVPALSDIRRYSLAQLTREALPRLDNYRQSNRILRPSLGELHGDLEKNLEPEKDSGQDGPAQHHGVKLGWIVGVLIPCLLNIWGVMLFLRLSWVVAQAGIMQSLIIIGVSAGVCVVTTLSLSALTTNGEVKSGGIYYIISRSLGPEFGASVGVVFAFANAVAASMNTIGFCSSLNDLLKEYDLKIIDGDTNDIRIVGSIAIVIMIIVCAVGMEWESKAQNGLIAIIVVSIFNFILGTVLGPSNDVERAQGFEGLSVSLFKENWPSNYRCSEGLYQDFFSVFAIFFPSVTGLQAGANISGDLKDPAKAIPKGTLLALLISMTSYGAFVLFAGGAALRDASGSIDDLINGTLSSTCTDNLIPCEMTCEYGLHNSYTAMQLISAWAPLIYAGAWAATISTALTNLLSVPRLIQALGYDRIYPGILFFSKPYGKNGEPYRGYVLTLIISILFLLIAKLNLIAPLISTFYLASYALINYCCFHAALVKPLGWRPTFRYYNVWLSLAGFGTCVAIMFLIDWLSSLITFIIIVILYLVVVYRKPDVNWGSSTQAQTYKTALSAAHRLQNVNEHVKNYRPQILVLAGKPSNRPPIVDLANLITKNNSMLIVGDVETAKLSYRGRNAVIKEGLKWMEARKIKGFYNVVDGLSFEQGVRALIQTTGIGKMAPNILMMGYKSDWHTCNQSDLVEYFNVLHNAFDHRLAVTILRLPNGIDFSHLTHEFHPRMPDIPGGITASSSTGNLAGFSTANSTGDIIVRPAKMMHCDSNLNLETIASSNANTITTPQAPPIPNQKRLLQQLQHNIVYATRGGSTVPKDIMDALSMFHRKQPKGTIDVWWLYDDGGLTMLIPYIISTRSHWSGCKIRVFALTNRKLELELEERNMANLLNKLRIDFSCLTMLQGVTEKPSEQTIKMHTKLLEGFGANNGNPDCCVTDEELTRLQSKTYRQLRLREMLLEHSTNASLIIMSLPMPRKGTISAPLYMSWLEVLTKDMPPFMLVRGNQSSVLTFYS